MSEVSVCSLTLYNNVVAKCFEECVSEFRRRELDVGEEKVWVSAPHTMLRTAVRLTTKSFLYLLCSAFPSVQKSLSNTPSG